MYAIKKCIPLYGACFKEHASIVECLLKNGAEVDIGRRNGGGPLYIACQNGHDIIVNYLFNKGANVYLCTNNGHSQLYAASFNGHHNTVELLLKSMPFWYMYMFTICLLCPELWKKIICICLISCCLSKTFSC